MTPPAIRLLHNRHLLILSMALILIAGLAAWINLPRIEDPRIATAMSPWLRPTPARPPHGSRRW
jgi:hypothetical protein